LKVVAGEGWRRLEKIVRTDRMKNGELFHRVKKERNILHAVRRRKTNGLVTYWVGTAF